ncbi:hypothetical protein GMMP1_1480024 [Candidatus Magnetomoraceae bacterium gMMP-1]
MNLFFNFSSGHIKKTFLTIYNIHINPIPGAKAARLHADAPSVQGVFPYAPAWERETRR